MLLELKPVSARPPRRYALTYAAPPVKSAVQAAAARPSALIRTVSPVVPNAPMPLPAVIAARAPSAMLVHTNTCVSCVDTGGAPVDTCAVCCDENAICKVVGNGEYKCKCEGAECDTGCCPPRVKVATPMVICEDFPFGCETAFARDDPRV